MTDRPGLNQAGVIEQSDNLKCMMAASAIFKRWKLCIPNMKGH